MDKNNPEIGVITEQGFVAGLGLGYTPTNLRQGFVAGLGLGYTPTNLGKDDDKNKDNKEKQG